MHGSRGRVAAARRSWPSCATASTTPPTSTLLPGCPPNRPQTAAVAQFGSPQAVADAFAGELATAYARRTIAIYIVTGPLVGIWWLLLLRPDPWRAGLIALLVAIPVLPLITIAIAAAGATLAGTGRLMRWLPEASPRRALAATIAIAALSWPVTSP